MNGYSPGTALQLLYAVRGNSDDYLYDGDPEANGKIFAMTPEVGGDSDGFWPPQSRIFPLAIENLGPNLYLSWVAGDYVSLQSYQFDKQYMNPGDQVQMNLTMKNKGLSNAENLTITLEAVSGFVSVSNGTATVPSIPSRGTYTTASPFEFSISPTAPIDTLAKLRIVTSKNGVTMSIDTVGFITGVPTFVFQDTTNNPLTNWTVTASPSTPKWEASTTEFHSGPTSFTDSKTGNYANNATVTMATTNPVSLTGYANPKLSFWTKWDMESQWDCGVLMISTNNGSTWTALTGKLTKPASGSGKQVPAGMPVYEGSSTSWKQEVIDLSAYANKSVKLKFELRTDGSQVRDGWYVDDIGVYVYAALPVELSAFSGTIAGDIVSLKWETASELNNRGFEVQRSFNGSGWSSVGFVDGKGTTASGYEYTFTEKVTGTGTIQYRLKQIDHDGTYRFYGPVDIESEIAITYALMQNYPNPFNPSTVIRYALPVAGVVTIDVFNALGEKVSTLLNGQVEAGYHSIAFDAAKLPSGLYFYKINSGNFTAVKKMLYLK